MSQGLASSTLMQYRSGQAKFFAFCAEMRAPPVPATEVLILRFVASWAGQLTAGTIQSYLSAVRYLHILNGLPNPLEHFERVRLVLRALKKRDGARRERAPVSIEMLSAIRRSLDFACYNNVLFWAATMLAFFGFLRVSEFTVVGAFCEKFDLSGEDAMFFADLSGVVLRLKSSKTDTFRKGVSVTIGATQSPLCPVLALIEYLRLRRNKSSGALFRFQNGRPLSRKWFSDRLKLACAASGAQGDFTAHSLRIGAATTAAAAGFTSREIQVLGRWTSDAYKLYIRASRRVLTSAARRLLRLG